MRPIFFKITFLLTLVSSSSSQFLPLGVFPSQPEGCQYPSLSDGTYIYFNHPDDPFHYSIYTPWRRFYPNALRADLAEQGFQIGLQYGSNKSDLCDWETIDTVKKHGWLRGKVSFRHRPGGGVKVTNATKAIPPAGTTAPPVPHKDQIGLAKADTKPSASMAMHLVNHTRRTVFDEMNSEPLVSAAVNLKINHILPVASHLAHHIQTQFTADFAWMDPNSSTSHTIPQAVPHIDHTWPTVPVNCPYEGPRTCSIPPGSHQETSHIPPCECRHPPKVQRRQEHKPSNKTLDLIHNVLTSNSPEADIVSMMLEISIPIFGVIGFLTLVLLLMRHVTNKRYPNTEVDSEQGEVELSSMRKSSSVKSDKTLVNPLPEVLKKRGKTSPRKEEQCPYAKNDSVFAWRLALERPAPPRQSPSLREEGRYHNARMGGVSGLRREQPALVPQPPSPLRQSSSVYSRSMDGVTLYPERNMGSWESL